MEPRVAPRRALVYRGARRRVGGDGEARRGARQRGLVTVFGGSGFVGGHIVRALAKAGARLRVAVRNPGRGYRLRMLGDVGQIEVVQANVRDDASVARALEGAEACVNAVAVLYEFRPADLPGPARRGRAALARRRARKACGRFVHISALGADPVSPARYARTKAAGEAAVREVLPEATIAAALGGLRTGRPLLQPLRLDGRDLAGLAPDRRWRDLVPAGLRGRRGGRHRRGLTSPAAAGRPFELGGPSIYSFRALMEILLAQIGQARLLLPVPFGMAGMIALAGDAMAAAGLTPPLTSDQLALLRADNVVSPGAAGLADLGVAASALEPMIPTYLYRFRKGGQYADLALGAAR